MADEQPPSFDWGQGGDEPTRPGPSYENTQQQPAYQQPGQHAGQPQFSTGGGGHGGGNGPTFSPNPQFGAPPPKKKRGWIIALVSVFVVLLVIGGLIVGGAIWAVGKAKDKVDETTQQADVKSFLDQLTTTTAPANNSPRLFPGRADAQARDQERNVGQSVALSGYTTTVNSASFQQSINDYSDSGYVVADVSIVNRDKDPQRYDTFDWSIQTPNGEIIDPSLTTYDGLLQSGNLVNGGNANGKVVFDVGDRKGDFYVIYKPDILGQDRGIWKVTL